MAQSRTHRYAATIVWTGAEAGPTRSYDSYARDYDIRVDGRPGLAGSSDAAFGGDPGRHNPEDLLLGALAACHMLWYLHLCAVKGVIVVAYEDSAEASMTEAPGQGRFTGAILRPRVTVDAGSDPERARALHDRAHKECFIANSVNFPVRCEAEIRVRPAAARAV